MTQDDDEIGASVDGIRRCLELLADEAAVLKLNATLAAIHKALAAVTFETSAVGGCSGLQAPAPAFLH